MEFIDLIAEFILYILEKVTRRNIGKRTQTVVDILVAALFFVTVMGYAIWRAVYHYRQGELFWAGFFASVVVIGVLLLGFFLIRRIVRNRKKKIEP